MNSNCLLSIKSIQYTKREKLYTDFTVKRPTHPSFHNFFENFIMLLAPSIVF